MDTLKLFLSKTPVHALCVIASLILVGFGMLAGSFSGGAIAIMLLAIYLRLPGIKHDEISLSPQSASTIRTMTRKPKNEKEQLAIIEFDRIFAQSMKG